MGSGQTGCARNGDRELGNACSRYLLLFCRLETCAAFAQLEFTSQNHASMPRPIELLNERFLLAQYALNGASKPFGVVCCAHEQTAPGGARYQESNEHDSEDGANLGELQGDEGWCCDSRKGLGLDD